MSKLMKDGNWDDVEFYVLFYFQEALCKTTEKYKEYVGEWLSSHYLFFELGSCISNSYPKSYLSNSLVYRKILEWQRSTLWSYLAAFSGGYECVARELRFLVEDILQAILADHKYPNKNLEKKILLVENPRLRGTKLIKATPLSEELQVILMETYETLSGYVHPSMKLVRASIKEGRILFVYDDARYQESLRLHKAVYDALLASLLSIFDKIVDCFLSAHHPNFTSLYSLLEYYKFHYTLDQCPLSFREDHWAQEEHELHLGQPDEE